MIQRDLTPFSTKPEKEGQSGIDIKISWTRYCNFSRWKN